MNKEETKRLIDIISVIERHDEEIKSLKMNKTTEDSLIILEQRYESACISRDWALDKRGELKTEIDMLANENIKFARYLRELGYNTTEIDNIAKGFDL